MFVAPVLCLGALTTFLTLSGDSIAALVTAGLTTVNTLLLVWNGRKVKNEIGPTLDHVKQVVDRRKLGEPDTGERSRENH